MKILVLNSGSSSQKSCVYEIGDAPPAHPPEPVWEGKIEWKDGAAEIRLRNSLDGELKESLKVTSHAEATEHLLHMLSSGKVPAVAATSEIDIVGHRIVNGGREYTEPTLITPEVKSAISRMSALAPLHNRAELEGIDLVQKKLGAVHQVAVFDTGFHSKLPDAAAVYPGPYEWFEQGIRRFGFHGINHQYCAGRAAQLLGKYVHELKLITCHLGNGCSLAAILGGKSIDTTMGFTPLEGLMMGTRSGSIDPGIMTYLIRQGQYTGHQLDEVLNTKSGLLGISGISGDMREIEAAIENGHTRAELAFDMFIHRLSAGIGAMISALNGIDALIFSAGIGENSSEVRAATCSRFEYLRLGLAPEKNQHCSGDGDISTVDSAVRVLVIRAQEDWAIARDCWKIAHKNLASANWRGTGR
jgi:acetate kinase